LQDTMIPELHWFETEYRYYLHGKGDEFVAFDLATVPALKPDMVALSEASHKLWSMGVPAEQAFTAVGLKVGEVPDGETAYLPMGVTPAGGSEKPPESVEGQPEATDKSIQRMHHKAVNRIAKSWEPQFAALAKLLFEKDKRAVLALIKPQKASMPNYIAFIEMLERYFFGDSMALWNKDFEPLLLGIGVDQGERWAASLGAGVVDPRQIQGSLWFQEYKLKFSDPLTRTSRDHLAQILAQGQDEGWSIPKIQGALNLTFDQWMDGDISPEDLAFVKARFPAYRTELIARTETMRASNGSQTNLFKQWNVPRHEWVATPDAVVREAHGMADGQVVKVGEPFNVGGFSMMYPGDMSGGAGMELIANCRCTTVPFLSTSRVERIPELRG